MSHRVDHVLGALPRRNAMDDDAWTGRHRLLLWLLAAHVPGLLAVALGTGRPAAISMLEVFPVFLATAAGLVLPTRLERSCAVSLGLVVSGTVLVHLLGGSTEAYFHFFAALGFVALYQ